MIDDSQLVEQLVRSDAISKKDLRRGLDLAKERGEGLYETLIAAELVDERTLIKLVGKTLNVRPVWLGERTPDADVTDRVPRSLAVRNNVLPLKFEAGDKSERLVLAMTDPLDVLAMDEIASHTGVDVRPVLAGLGDLARGLRRVYGTDGLEKSPDAASLDALEQAASGEAGLDDGGLTTSSAPEIELVDEVEDDSLTDDSWATFFDEAENVDYTEDSAVISRDMQDRAISNILDAVDSESSEDSDDDDDDSLKSLDEPLSRSQITGGIEPDLGDWEVDGALDGDESKDYAKIGHLFVYSPEKAAARSDSEAAVEEAKDKKKEDKRKKERTKKEQPKEERPKEERPKEKQEESQAPHTDKTSDAPAASGPANEPPAAIINPLRKLKAKVTPVGKDSQADQESLADDSEADEPDDQTSVGGGFFDGYDEPQASSHASEATQSDDEDDEDDDTSNNTAFGFGPGTLLADGSEAEWSEPESSEPESSPSRPASESETEAPAPDAGPGDVSLQQMFVARLAELADLDKESQRLIDGASPDDLIYAVVLALAQNKMLDVRDLLEYIKP